MQCDKFSVLGMYDVTCYHTAVCLGIGSIGASDNSLIQFALALLLKEYLQCPVYMYDPVCSSKERVLIRESGCYFDTDNRQCNINITELSRVMEVQCDKALFYMPHCGWRLYSNVLYSHWSRELLSSLCIIGNSFFERMIHISTPPAPADASADYVARCRLSLLEMNVSTDHKGSLSWRDADDAAVGTTAPAVREFGTVPSPQAFYDMAVHVFPLSMLTDDKMFSNKIKDDSACTELW